MEMCFLPLRNSFEKNKETLKKKGGVSGEWIVIPYLLRGASRCGIGDGPGCLFPCSELGLLKDFNQHREDICIYDSLREN